MALQYYRLFLPGRGEKSFDKAPEIVQALNNRLQRVRNDKKNFRSASGKSQSSPYNSQKRKFFPISTGFQPVLSKPKTTIAALSCRGVSFIEKLLKKNLWYFLNYLKTGPKIDLIK
jgi:hypothetical protein